MNQTLEGLEGYFSFVTPFRIATDGPTEIAISVSVTPRLFDLLGRNPMLGTRAAATTNRTSRCVLSHGFWQRRFGGDPDVIGRTLQIWHDAGDRRRRDAARLHVPVRLDAGAIRLHALDDDRPVGADALRRAAGAAVNRMLTPQGQLVRGTHWLGAIGRMKPGVTVDEVQADMSDGRAADWSRPIPTPTPVGAPRSCPVLDQTVGTIRAPAARAARRRRVRADHRRPSTSRTSCSRAASRGRRSWRRASRSAPAARA